MADLSTSACGRLRSNMITICLVNSGPILPTILMALSTLRLAQVKTSCLKSICLSAAKETRKPVVKLLKVSGQRLLAVVRFKMAWSLCSGGQQNVAFIFLEVNVRLRPPLKIFIYICQGF